MPALRQRNDYFDHTHRTTVVSRAPLEPRKNGIGKTGSKDGFGYCTALGRTYYSKAFFETLLIENASIRCVPVGVLPADGETGIDSFRIDSGGELRRDSLLSMWVVQ